MTDTYTKENMIHDKCHETGAHVSKTVFRERDVCKSHCFMIGTCGKDSMCQSVFIVTNI
jgi:hypothetical protein